MTNEQWQSIVNKITTEISINVIRNQFIIWYLLIHISILFWQSISVLHTSASLALNESWDPDVRLDINWFVQFGADVN